MGYEGGDSSRTRRTQVFGSIGCFGLLSSMSSHFAISRNAEVNGVIILFAVCTERFRGVSACLGDVNGL